MCSECGEAAGKPKPNLEHSDTIRCSERLVLLFCCYNQMEVWYQHQCCDLNMLTQHYQLYCGPKDLAHCVAVVNTNTQMQIAIRLLLYMVEIN